MDIRKCIFDKDAELQQLVDLQNMVYKQRGLVFTKDDFLFWYRKNPEGPVISYNAFEGDCMVAHQSFIPERMWVDDRVVKCLRSMAVVTHPDYRGQGLFSQLTNRAVEEAQRQGYDFIYAVTNANSFPIFIKHCGFSFISRLEVKIGLGVNVKENGEKTYKRHWTEETLRGRLSYIPYNREKDSIIGTYKLGFKLYMGTLDGHILNMTNLQNKSKAWGPLLYVGLGAKLPCTYIDVPRFIKHSPFNLVFRDLTGGKLPPMTKDNVFYQLIDYDVA